MARKTKLTKKIIYDPRQLKAAVDFVNTNNLLASTTTEEVMSLVIPMLRKDVGIVGTAGWYCSISEDSTHITLDFLVDPSLGSPSNYIEAEVKHVEAGNR